MFKILIDYLPEEEEVDVVNNTTQIIDNTVENILTGQDILDFQRIARQVPAADVVTRYAVREQCLSAGRGDGFLPSRQHPTLFRTAGRLEIRDP